MVDVSDPVGVNHIDLQILHELEDLDIQRIDEFDLERFKAGQVYVVPARLASMLIIAGYAEMVDDHPARAEAADFGQPRFPKRK